MKKHAWLFAAAAAGVLTACIPSVYPFYTAKDISFDPHLVGDWQDQNGSDSDVENWKFEAAADKVYKLTVTEKEGKKGQFEAVLFKLGDQRFLDIIPSDCDYAKDQADLVAASMFPGHLLIHVSQIGPELKMAMTDFDWLQKHLESNPTALAHHEEDKRIVLTASTSDLQQFILKHLAGGELFGDTGTLIRVTNSPVATPPAGQ